jgi:hypothetical protein
MPLLWADPLVEVVGGLGRLGVGAAGAAGACCAAGATAAPFEPLPELAFSCGLWVPVARVELALLVAATDPEGLCWLLTGVVPACTGAAGKLGLLAADELDLAGLLLVPPQPAINTATPTPAAARQVDLLDLVRLVALLILNFRRSSTNIATSSLGAAIAR